MANLIVAEESLNDIELVIFDKDGTLFDLHRYWSFVIIERAKYFSEMFSDYEINSIYLKLVSIMGLVGEDKISNEGPVGINSRNHIVEIVYKFLKTEDNNISIQDVEEGFSIVDSTIDNNFDKVINKMPGVGSLLSSLKESKCLIALATTDISNRTNKVLMHEKMFEYFDCIVGSDQVINSKPSVDMVDLILNSLNVKNKKNVVLIGDSVADLDMSINSGIRVIGVKTGLHSNRVLLDSRILVDTLLEVKVGKNVN